MIGLSIPGTILHSVLQIRVAKAVELHRPPAPGSRWIDRRSFDGSPDVSGDRSLPDFFTEFRMSGPEIQSELSRDEFLRALSPRSTEERDVVEKLMAWSGDHGLTECYRDYVSGAAFTPRIERPHGSRNLMLVRARGSLVIPLRWLSTRPPLDNLKTRRDLIARFETIPGNEITDNALNGFPKVSLSGLSDLDSYKKCIEVLESIVNQIRSHDQAVPAGRTTR